MAKLHLVDEPPIVAMCAGKHCRKHCSFAELRNSLVDDCKVVNLKCVGLCNGPVVVLNPRSKKPLVLSSLRRPKQQRDIVRLVLKGKKLSARLKSHRIKDKRRKRVLRNLPKTIASAS